MKPASRNMTSENLKDAQKNAHDDDCKLKHSHETLAARPYEIRTSSPNDKIISKVNDVEKTVYSDSINESLQLYKITKIDSKTNATQLKSDLHSSSLEKNNKDSVNIMSTRGLSENCSFFDRFRKEIPISSINVESQKGGLSNLEDNVQKDAIQSSLDISLVMDKRKESRISVKTDLCTIKCTNHLERTDNTPSCETETRCSGNLLDRSSCAINEENLIQDVSRRISVEVPSLGAKIDKIVPFVKSEPQLEQYEKEGSCEDFGNLQEAKLAEVKTLKPIRTEAKNLFVKPEMLSSECTERRDDKSHNKDELSVSSEAKTPLLNEKRNIKGNIKIGGDEMVMIKSETDVSDIIENDTMKCLKNIETEYENDILDIKKEVNLMCKESVAFSGADMSCVKEEIDVSENEILGESELHFADSNLAKIRKSLQEEVLLKNENEDGYDESPAIDDGTIQIEIETVKDEIVEEPSSLSSRTLVSALAVHQPDQSLGARPPMMLYQPSTPNSALVMQILPMNLLVGTQSNFLPVLSTSEETILPTTFSFGAHQNRFITHTIRAGQSEGEVITDSVSSSDSSRMDNLLIQQDAYGLLEPKVLTKFANFKCPQCGKTYMKRKPFENHMRDHDITTTKVAKLLQTNKEKRMQTAKAIATRYRIPIEEQTDEFLEMISRKGKFHCKHCQKCYLFFSQMKQHEGFCLTLSKMKDCTELDLNSECEVEAEEQLPKEYVCICGRKYLRRSRLETCLRSHDSAQVTCGMCRKMFPSKLEYQKHRREVHFKRLDKEPETLLYKCKFCPAMFNTQGDLIKHLKMHKKRQLEQLQEISKRLSVKEDRECFLCAEKFTTDIFLREHLDNSHSSPYPCNLCSVCCDTVPNYRDHVIQCHKEADTKAIQDALRVSKDNSTHWTCSICSESFVDSNKFLAHTRSHRKRASADRKASITKFRFHCQHCEETFPTLGALMSHRSVEHGTDGIKPIPKIVGEENLPVASEPEVKMDTDQEDERMCVHCRKMCRNMEALAMHMRFHSTERGYPCKYCDFRFSNSEKLKKHGLIHTGTLKFVCFICEYRCASQNKLLNHKQSLKHDETKKALLESWPDFDKDLAETIAKRKLETSVESVEGVCEKDKIDIVDVVFSCDLCNEKFTSEDCMSKHKLATHPFIEFPDDKSQRIFFK